VGQLCAAYLLYAGTYYRDAGGNPAGDVTHATIAFDMLVKLNRDTPIDRVRIADLLAVRQALVDQRETRKHGRQAPN
jgi:hypothetical protein